MCAVLVWITGLLVGVRQDPKRRQNHREGTGCRPAMEDECFSVTIRPVSKKSQPRTFILAACTRAALNRIWLHTGAPFATITT